MEFKIIEKFEEFENYKQLYQDLLGRIDEYQIFYEFDYLKNYVKFSPLLRTIHNTGGGKDNMRFC